MSFLCFEFDVFVREVVHVVICYTCIVYYYCLLSYVRLSISTR